MGSDDDDDDDSDADADQSDKLPGKQQIGLFEDAISLDQVCRGCDEEGSNSDIFVSLGQAHRDSVDLADACIE